MKNILLIEDDESIAEVMTLILRESGFNVIHDATGESLNKTTTSHINLVLMDYLLPHTTGALLIQKLKNQPEFTGVPVILMSANTEGELSRIAEEVGADGYLPKPFDISSLKEKVTQLISH